MANGTLLCISGSLRRDSYNTRLVHEAARLFAPDKLLVADLRLPLYDGDLEAEGRPAPVQALIDQVREADAVAISTPEYNKGVSGVLKNALDWLSRDKPMALVGKPVAIMSAAAGRAGGERAQYGLRLNLVPFNPRVLNAPEVLVAQAEAQFDGPRLVNEINLDMLKQLMANLRAEAGLPAVSAEAA